MENVLFRQADPLFYEEVADSGIALGLSDYRQRLALLRGRIEERGLTHAVLYGDREHFSNIEYFCGFDCRFEEALLIVDVDGGTGIVVGNEGVSQTYAIPFAVDVHLYQHFSLQGQPRDRLESLPAILAKAGIGADSKVGLAGFKYFEADQIDTDPAVTFDVPAYIVQGLQAACPSVVNLTQELTGIPDGIRMTVRSAREIACIENAGNRTASVVMRMMKALKPGLSELEVSRAGQAAMYPTNVFPMINFGPDHVRIGIRSPDLRPLSLGEVCTLCYSTRGNLTSRVGIACYDEGSAAPELRPHLDFYQHHWYAVTRWAECARVGVGFGALYDAVMDVIGGPAFGVTLNPSHYAGTEEWPNSPVHKNAPHHVMDASHMQVDIIASRADPVMTSICEDCVVVAGDALRRELAREFPAVYARIQRRQEVIRSVLGIRLHDDVLPMSNLNFVYTPYMLNLDRVFALQN